MTAPLDRIASARSMLFVPGHRPYRFAKAAGCDADLVLLDLEDAVAAEDKDRARDHVADWLEYGNTAAVRINPPETPWFDDDLAVAARYGCPMMVPKAENPAALADITAQTAGTCALILLIETAAGVEHATDLCATPGAVRAAFGNVDLASQLGGPDVPGLLADPTWNSVGTLLDRVFPPKPCSPHQGYAS